jgi:simple sugar transport system permease protein
MTTTLSPTGASGTGGSHGPSSPAPVARHRWLNVDWTDLAIHYGLVAIIIGTVVYFWITEPTFGTTSNLFSSLQSVSIVGVIATGVTFSLVVGGFDLSIGANAGLTSMFASIAMVAFGQGTLVAVLVAVAIGVLVGLVNSALIIKARIPDLVATLGMLFLLDGLQLIPGGGQTIVTGMTIFGRQGNGAFPSTFLDIGRAQYGPVPLSVILFIVLAVLSWLYLEKTRWGRAMYAIGGNPEAARLAGIRVNLYKTFAYVLSGVLSGFGGVILASQIGQGNVGAGDPFLLQAVACALIGFALLGVNRPNALGTAVGAVFIGVMLDGLTIKNFPYYTQNFVQGVILIFALLLSFAFARRR